jgi:hypothetical protein
MSRDKVSFHLVNQTVDNDSENYTSDGFMSLKNPLVTPMLVKIPRPIPILETVLRLPEGEYWRNRQELETIKY